MLEIIGNIGSTLFDYIVGLGLDAGSTGLKKKFDQHKLKKALADYISTHSNIKDPDSLDAEIDYQGLARWGQTPLRNN